MAIKIHRIGAFFIGYTTLQATQNTLYITLNNNSEQQVLLSEQFYNQQSYTGEKSSCTPHTYDSIAKELIHEWNIYSLLPTNWSPFSWKTVVISACLSYATCFMWLVWKNHAIKKSSAWSQWKDDIPFSILQEMERTKLEELILKTFKEKYGSYNLATIEQFINEIKQEKKQIQQFINTIEWLEKIKLGFLFPSFKILRSEIPLKMQRFDFVYQTVEHRLIKQLLNY